ncbi:MAG: hypothetical protein HQL26_05420 [Candidatus Omnitrophica bacterium]|nr:hypothetical protein [Candidatus Omnitrophota bacterium]
MQNKSVLITCGPTWTPIDDMRVISNKSSGTLGHILADLFCKKGFKVTLLEGPVQERMKPVKNLTIIPFQYYSEFRAELLKALKQNFDIVVHAAAVSDYQLKKPFNQKVSSHLKELKLTLVPTEKLISLIKQKSPKSCLVGFKLESSIAAKSAIRKTEDLFNQAQCDLVILNSLTGNKYYGVILNKNREILAQASSREEIANHLIKIFNQKPTNNDL